MTVPTRPAALAIALSLAACAAPAPQPASTAPAPSIAGPGLPLALPLQGERARTLLEQVAARCWLDGVVRGGSMVVDRQTGQVIITSDTADLLVAQPVPAGDGTIVRLTGPAAEDPATALRLSETLERAATTGQTSCPPAAVG